MTDVVLSYFSSYCYRSGATVALLGQEVGIFRGSNDSGWQEVARTFFGHNCSRLAHEPDQVEKNREAALGELLRVVLRRQPDVNRPHEGIAEGIALQHLRRVRAVRPGEFERCLVGTIAPEMLRNDSRWRGLAHILSAKYGLDSASRELVFNEPAACQVLDAARWPNRACLEWLGVTSREGDS